MAAAKKGLLADITVEPAAPSEDVDEMDASEDELDAAQSLLDAVAAKDAAGIVEAFRALSLAVEG